MVGPVHGRGRRQHGTGRRICVRRAGRWLGERDRDAAACRRRWPSRRRPGADGRRSPTGPCSRPRRHRLPGTSERGLYLRLRLVPVDGDLDRAGGAERIKRLVRPSGQPRRVRERPRPTVTAIRCVLDPAAAPIGFGALPAACAFLAPAGARSPPTVGTPCSRRPRTQPATRPLRSVGRSRSTRSRHGVKCVPTPTSPSRAEVAWWRRESPTRPRGRPRRSSPSEPMSRARERRA